MVRNLRNSKYYTDLNVGQEGYNPQIIQYYNSTDQLIKVEEIWRGQTYSQTISGTGISSQTVNYNIVYDPWIEIN